MGEEKCVEMVWVGEKNARKENGKECTEVIKMVQMEGRVKLISIYRRE